MEQNSVIHFYGKSQKPDVREIISPRNKVREKYRK